MTSVLLGAFSILLAAQAAQAMPATQANIVGTVRDAQTSAPLTGAVVMLSDLDRAAATDSNGRYVIAEVPAGPQHVAVRLIGYAQRSLHALVPRDGQLEINFSLLPQPVRLKTVEVRAPVSIRGLDGSDTTSFPDRETSIAAARNHPLLAETDVFQAIGGGDVVLRPETPSGVHIEGGASDQTAYLLDGVPVFSPFHTAGVSSAWNPDALLRLRVSSSAPSASSPHALSGAVEAVTRDPGSRFSTQGGISTTQTRLTFDGPLGGAGAGYLVSLRSGLPGALAPRRETSYMRGETGDGLAKLEAPALGGRLRLLGYDSVNEIDAAAAVDTVYRPGQVARRNGFEWHSQSLGLEWRRELTNAAARVLAWGAVGSANSDWAVPSARVAMTAERRDQGMLAAIERRSGRASTVLELRVEQSRTSYRVEPDSSGPSFRVRASTPVATGSASHARPIGAGLDLDLGASLAATDRGEYLEPRIELRWKTSGLLTVFGSYARTHQFAQSLRNAESVVGNVFPVELFVGSGAPSIPVARSDQGVVAADYRPLAGVRMGLKAYHRQLEDLILVAPRDGEPFTTGGFTTGSGTARGVSLEAGLSTARCGLMASYGLQRVRLDYGDSSYVPDHGASQVLEGGVIVFPDATASIRLGAAAAFGRRTTTIPGVFEWEANNLVDRGSEFVGSPHYGDEPLGGTELPPYFRVDLGLRKHWHVPVGGRDAMVALFGTFTNILNRKNVLTYSRDPSTGQVTKIEMRPQAPLVVGLDWRF